jgi:hypothetical protein
MTMTGVHVVTAVREDLRELQTVIDASQRPRVPGRRRRPLENLGMENLCDLRWC